MRALSELSLKKSARRKVGGVMVYILVVGHAGLAQSGGRGSAPSGPYEATPQRPTFTASTSTTAPGTLELEFGATSSGSFLTLPTTLKYTPDVRRGVLHRAEFSLSFDAISRVDVGGRHVTHFGNSLGFVIRRPVYIGESFSLAVAPRAIFLLRGDRGARLGARLLAAYTFGLNSVVGRRSGDCRSEVARVGWR